MYTFALIGLVVLALLGALFLFISLRPNTFRVERIVQINAPADLVFGFINDLHQWNQWSPFEKLDPNMKKTWTGPTAGPGAAYAWNGKQEGRRRSSDDCRQPGRGVRRHETRIYPTFCVRE
jgi:hypothetical protein